MDKKTCAKMASAVLSYAIWLMKKWRLVFGVVLSVTTMIVAPSIYAFGIMDLPLAVTVLASLLYAWIGEEKSEETDNC